MERAKNATVFLTALGLRITVTFSGHISEPRALWLYRVVVSRIERLQSRHYPANFTRLNSNYSQGYGDDSRQAWLCILSVSFL